MFRGPQLFISIDPIPGRPFYTTGDTIRGTVSAEVGSQFSFGDIQIKLKCDEWFPGGKKKSKQKRRLEKWSNRIDTVQSLAGVDVNATNLASKVYMDHKKHFSLAANVLQGADPNVEGDQAHLTSGRHSFPFELVIPERANACPPTSFFGDPKGQPIGVVWMLKVVIHRTSGFKPASRSQTDITVFPKSEKMLQTPDLLAREKYFNTMMFVEKKRLFQRSTSRLNLYLSGELSLPRAGLPQGPVPSQCALQLISQERPVTVQHVRIVLLRSFRTSERGVKFRQRDIFSDEILLGEASVHRVVHSATNLSELVSEFALRRVLPPAFTSVYTRVTYTIKARVRCQSPFELKEDRRRYKTACRELVLQGPVDVLSPLYCFGVGTQAPSAPSYEEDAKALEEVHQKSVSKAEEAFSRGQLLENMSIDDEQLPEYEDTRNVDEPQDVKSL